MPFTLSHPAAVLPLRRSGLPMSALVMGSMVPDVGVFTGWGRLYHQCHSLVGIVTIDLTFGMVALLLWFGVVRDALVDLAPAIVRSRLRPRVRLSLRQWLLAPVAVAIGSLTHVWWDAYTHAGRWGTRQVPWLHERHLFLSGAGWAQLASSAVGLVVLCVAAAAHLRRSPAYDERDRVLSPVALYGVVLIATVVGTAAVLRAAPYGWHAMAFDGVTSSLSTFVSCGLVVAVVWTCARTTAGPHGG